MNTQKEIQSRLFMIDDFKQAIHDRISQLNRISEIEGMIDYLSSDSVLYSDNIESLKDIMMDSVEFSRCITEARNLSMKFITYLESLEKILGDVSSPKVKFFPVIVGGIDDQS